MARAAAQALSHVICTALLVSFALHSGCLQEAPVPSVERGIAALIPLLRDESADLRRTAAESLGKIGDRSAVTALLPVLSDPTPSVRAAAAQALGRMAIPGDEAAVSALARALQDPSDRVKQVAALAIGEIDPTAGELRPIVELLRAHDVHVKRAAVRALLVGETGPFTEALLPLLDDPDAEVRQGAAAAIGLSRDPRAAAALEKRLARDSSPAVRAEAAYHVGKLSGGDIRTRLHALYEKEPDEGVRRWIQEDLKGSRVND